MLLDIEARVAALTDHLGVKLKRVKCPNDVCRFGRFPDGGYCPTCGGSGVAYIIDTSAGDGSLLEGRGTDG